MLLQYYYTHSVKHWNRNRVLLRISEKRYQKSSKMSCINKWEGTHLYFFLLCSAACTRSPWGSCCGCLYSRRRWMFCTHRPPGQSTSGSSYLGTDRAAAPAGRRLRAGKTGSCSIRHDTSSMCRGGRPGSCSIRQGTSSMCRRGKAS